MAKNNTLTEVAEQIESKLEPIFTDKLPGLSDGVKEFIVKITPYLAIFSMVMLLPILLAALGLSAIFLPISLISSFQVGFGSSLGLIFAIIMIVLEIMAIPGLFKRQMSAWKLMFYVTLLSVLQNVLSFNLGGLVIGGGISCYLLFQIKTKYNK